MRPKRKDKQTSIMGVISLVALLLMPAASAAAQAGSAAREVFKGSKEFHKRLERTDASMERYVEDLERTMRSLRELSRSGKQVRKRYEEYSKNLRALERSQSKAASDIEGMRSVGTEYFSKWDRSITQMADPTLREQSENARSQLIAKYDGFSRRISDVAVSLPTMMGTLRDLNVFFGADVTKETVKKASDPIQACRSDYETLKSKISDARKALKELLNEAPK